MSPVLQDICQGCAPYSLVSSLHHQKLISDEEAKTGPYGGLFLTSYY